MARSSCGGGEQIVVAKATSIEPMAETAAPADVWLPFFGPNSIEPLPHPFHQDAPCLI